MVQQVTVHHVDVSRFVNNFDPMLNGVWNGTRLYRATVQRAINENRVCKEHSIFTFSPNRLHAERIAWLVLNGWNDAILIDVGVPELSAWRCDWPIFDGNHRLAAALFRGDEKIACEIGGSVQYAHELFGVKI